MMNAFCGIYNKSGGLNALQAIDAMKAAIRLQGTTSKYASKTLALLIISGTDKPENCYFEDERYFACLDGMVFSVPSDEEFFPRTIKLFNTQPDKLRGEFSFVLYDKQSNELKLFRDQLGTRPLYYIDHPDFTAFSSDLAALRALPGISCSVDEQFIADTISTVKSEQWRTAYSEIRRLPPANFFRAGSEEGVFSYWELKADPEPGRIDFQEAAVLFREKLSEAVRRRMGNCGGIASELSGGLDSSGVTAVANLLLGKESGELLVLSHGFRREIPVPYFPYRDERAYSRALCEYSGIAKQQVCDGSSLGLLEQLRESILVHSGPTQQNYSIFSDVLYKAAHDSGAGILLSGFGGDEGVSSKASGFFEELSAKGDWSRYKNEYFLRGRINGLNPLGTLAKYWIHRYLPGADKIFKRQGNAAAWVQAKFSVLAPDRDFAGEMNIRSRFLAESGFPVANNVRERQFERLNAAHLSQRLEYSARDAQAYGLSYTYPLLDLDLLEFYFSLPAEYKFREGWDRAVFREAMLGLVPEKIRLRKDTAGMTVPTIHKRFLNDYDEVLALIIRSREQNRFHYLDYEKMLTWASRIKERTARDRTPVNASCFFNSLKVLLLQEMEREGSFHSGIRV